MIYIGNVKFDDIFKRTGYQLNSNDKELWDKYYNDSADLQGMDNCFHMFRFPLEIHCIGEEAFRALSSIFQDYKLINPKGKFKIKLYVKKNEK